MYNVVKPAKFEHKCGQDQSALDLHSNIHSLIQCQSSVHQVWTHTYSQTSAYNTEAQTVHRDCHAYAVAGGSIVHRCCCTPVSHNINGGNFVWVWKLVPWLRVIPRIVLIADISLFLHNQRGDHR